MKQWEYAQLFTDGPASHDALQDFGNDGWELVAVVSRRGQPLLYVFKRPVAGGFHED